jgi:hypothetical protein
LHREFKVGALADRLKIEGIEGNGETLAIRVHGFARDDTLVRNDQVIHRLSAKLGVVLGSTSEEVSPTGVDLIVDQDVV